MRNGFRRTLRALGALALAAAVAVPVVSAVSSPETAIAATTLCASTPFRSSPSHHYWYRIPSLAKSNGTVVYAFAEKRDNDSADDGNFDIAMVRSSNNGCTWSSPRVIFSHGTDRVSNPVAVVGTNGRVYLFASARYAVSGTKRNNLYLMTSEDAFASKRILNTFKYSGGLAGPGGSVTLRHGAHAGRMIVPLSTVSGTRTGVTLLYSDDLGATWQTGGVSWNPSGTHLIEPAVAELSSGQLLISLRDSQLVKGHYKTAGNTRYFTTSSDAGVTLGTIGKGHAPKIVSVQASMLTTSSLYTSYLFMVAPAGITPGQPEVRRQEAVFVSATRGQTWHPAFHLEGTNNPGAYSDIAEIDSSTVGVLYESGVKSYKEVIKYETDRITTIVKG